MATVYRFVLTGGPCGGKTTALAKISERLQSLGFHVFLVPEAATMLMTGGVSFHKVTPEQLVHIESNFLTFQMSMEEVFINLAKVTDQPSVVIFDRGTMDVSAYIPQSTWQALLDERGWSTVALRDQRYDAVIHLVTAAIGAENFYTLSNNTARTETPEQARSIDKRLHDAWLGHPHLRVIDNSTDFSGKISRVVQSVCRVVGVPEPVEVERKFLVRFMPVNGLPVRFERVEIEQTYLQTQDGSEARVRRRGQYNSFTYTHTIKKPLRSGQRVEVERPISAREYLSLLTQANPSLCKIKKFRHCFLWQNHYFELDQFIEPRSGLLLLEVELDDEKQNITLPPFLEIEREVTDEAEFSNYAMAKKGK